MGGAFRCGFGFPSFDRSLDRSLECFVVDTLDALDTQCLSREGPRSTATTTRRASTVPVL